MNICIDFGGTNIKIGLVADGRVISRAAISAESDKGLLARLPVVEAEVRRLLGECKLAPEDCSGMGIALPGIVDSTRKQLISINEKYLDAVGFDFAGWAQSTFSLPLEMENDARAALIGEVGWGAAKDEKNVVLVIFGTGIGTAAMINGQILRGKHYQAGILGGHIATNVYGEKCTCGNYGCVEAQASHWAIPIRANSMPGFEHSSAAPNIEQGYKAVTDAFLAGDPFAVKLFDDLMLHWSAGVISLIHAYDPEVIVLSGGLMKAGDFILNRMEALVNQRAWTPWGKVRFRLAPDPETSVLLGASRLLTYKEE